MVIGYWYLAIHILATASIVSIQSTIALGEFRPKGGYFEGKLQLLDVAEQFVDHGEYDTGHTEFRLLSNYSFRDEKGRLWTVPAGTVVNGASIPKTVWSWIGGPWSGRYRNAAVIHDWMCEKQIADSDTAHRVFYEALLAGGVSRFRSWVMYQAVLRGGPQWKATAFGPGPVKRPDLSKADLERIISEAKKRGLQP